jgi:hypothetical protein
MPVERGPPRDEDQQAPDLARPPGRRERGFLLRRLHRGRQRAPNRPSERQSGEMLRDRIEAVLKTLTYREREIIKLRYGIGDGYTYTLEEVGKIFKVTRERVRQVEAKADPQAPAPGPRAQARGLPRRGAEGRGRRRPRRGPRGREPQRAADVRRHLPDARRRGRGRRPWGYLHGLLHAHHAQRRGGPRLWQSDRDM